MRAEDLKLLLRKVEELKALLVFTERTIPFLEDVIAFVRDIVPMVEELKSSVESTRDTLPRASIQLDKVSTATELATTEILNIVEGMMSKVDRLRGNGETDPTLVSIQEDCTNIMIALQVQDITAQQIAAVNRLMQSVDMGLTRLLAHFADVATEQEAETRFQSGRLNIVFDTTAEYGGAAERQRVADAVVASARQKAERQRAGRKRRP